MIHRNVYKECTSQSTVVWEKSVVENIHMKIIQCKKIFAVAGIRQKILPLNFFNSSW